VIIMLRLAMQKELSLTSSSSCILNTKLIVVFLDRGANYQVRNSTKNIDSKPCSLERKTTPLAEASVHARCVPKQLIRTQSPIRNRICTHSYAQH
jgi:hypothetical protein